MKFIALFTAAVCAFASNVTFAETSTTEPLSPVLDKTSWRSDISRVCIKPDGRSFTQEMYIKKEENSERIVWIRTVNGEKVAQGESVRTAAGITEAVYYVRTFPEKKWLKYETAEREQGNKRMVAEILAAIGLTREELNSCVNRD